VVQRGRTPSFRELKEAMGLHAVSSVAQHINALRRKGYLRSEDRSIALVGDEAVV
jgi:SOS-response transcriptional repressor LexA